MTNAVIAEQMAEMDRLQAELRERSARHRRTTPIVRKIQRIRTQIMQHQYPKPKKVYQVQVESRRV